MHDSICYSKLKEIKSLTVPQIDTLTDILFNMGFGGPILIIQEIACYDPRNAILFVDNAGNTFAYIEICFECQHTRTSSEKIAIGDICNQKFALIKKFFIKAGIEYGTKMVQDQ